MSNHLRVEPAVRPVNTLSANFTAVYDWAVTADQSSDNLDSSGRDKKKKLNKVLFCFGNPT